MIAKAAAALETELYAWLVERVKTIPVDDLDEDAAAMARMASRQVLLTIGIARLALAEVPVNGFEAALARLDVVRESAEEFLRDELQKRGTPADTPGSVH